MKTSLLPAIVTLLFGAAAAAAGEPTSRWTGFYLGANVGAGWAKTRLSIPRLATFDGVGLLGVQGGLTAGFDYRFAPSYVLGVAVDGSLNSTSAERSFGPFGETRLRQVGSWAFRGRVGALATPDTLLYATGGVTEIFTELDFPRGGRRSAQFVGALVGVGVETRLADDLYGRVEYVHGLFGKRDFLGGRRNAEPETGVARFGLVYKPDLTGSVESVPPAPAAPLRADWTGLHIGAHGGYGWSSTRISVPDILQADGRGAGGGLGGALIGYDFQYERLVFGLEADGSVVDVSSSRSLTLPPFSASVAHDWDYSARGRAGYLFGDTLIFGTGGWSQSFARWTRQGVVRLERSHVFSGVQFGAGFETMLTSEIGVRLEYLHSFYDRYAVLGTSIGATPTMGKTRAALIYKF